MIKFPSLAGLLLTKICLLTTLIISEQASAQDSVVVFNEVHYHPEDDDTSIEYIELYNQLAVDVDISNWRIDGDIDFNFPEGTVISGRGYLVIAKDPAALATATGYSGALGPYNRNLSNSGDPIYLYSNNVAFRTQSGSGSVGETNDNLEGRRIMDVLEYSDTYPWPIAPDGSGFSLAKRDPNTGTKKASNWTVSSQANGTPGTVNTFSALPSLSINEVTSADEANFEIELYNYGSTNIALGGLIIASSDELSPDYTLPAGTLAPGAFLQINAATLGFTPEDNNRLFLHSAGKITLIDTARVDDSAIARSPDGTGRWARPDYLTLGLANVVTIEDGIVINEIFYHAKAQIESGGISTTSQQVLDYDATWRYNLDAGAGGLPSGWASSSHAVDNVSWAQGQGLLGVENSALGEPIRTTMTLTGNIPYYFETEFTYNGTATVSEMVINHYVDDGAIFYLNGVEIGRYNMDLGIVSPTTVANPGVGNAALRTLIISSPNLLQGSNRLSVEVHQINTGSSDIVFGANVVLTEESTTNFTPYAEREEEWLELYNRTAAPIDLTDWELEGGISYDFPDATIIPAGGYLVIAKDAAALQLKHPSITVLGDYSGRLGNGGELLTLKDSNGNTADEVEYYDSGKWHNKADGGGSSLELRDPHSDNSVAGAWAPSDESSRSVWQTYTYEGTATDDGVGPSNFHELQMGLLDGGEFLIDDVSVIEENTTEFIQNGDFESDGIGSTPDKWRVIGTHGSHGKTVVVTDPENAGNKCLHVVSTGSTENKHNKIETTFTNDEEIVLGNSYRISFRAKHLSGSNQLNSRLYFNYLQRTTVLEEPTVWGTPGLPNSVAVSNAGPALSKMSHSPVVPNANQGVSVSINASDVDGISAIQVKYSVNGGSFQTASMTLNPDGRYVGTVPGQAASALVQFYVEATDSSSATSHYPASAASGGAFYKVQDGLADTTGKRGNLRILMTDDDYDWLLERTNKLSDDRLPATIIENEQTVYYDVNLRLKGSPVGRDGNSNHEYVIRFQPDQLFRGVQNSIAIERGSLGQQLFSKHLNNRSGTTYTSAYDDVAYIIPPDDGDRGIGLLFMARNTGSFFDSFHPEDADQGTLFNLELLYSPTNTTDGDPESLKLPRPTTQTGARYDLKSYGPDKETVRWGFEIRSARDRDDYSRIIDLNEVFELEGTAFESAFEEVADVDQWMRVFALMALNGTDDVFSQIWEHNFRFYVRPDGKVTVMQWDLDRAFRLSTSNPNTIIPTTNGNGDTWSVAKLFGIPRFKRLYDGHIDDLIQTTFNSDYLSSWATELQDVSGINFNSYLSYVTNRANLVANNILPANVNFEITTNGGNDFSEADSVVGLSGDGSFDVFSIEVNGIPTPVTWIDGDSWQMSIPISIGPNPLTLTAYNRHGVEVGTDTITITNTSSVELANASNTIVSELHYHPANPSSAEETAGFLDDGDFEFIELMNISSSDVNYTNVEFTDGITFTFPSGIVLAPGERLVVAANQAAFEFRYGANSAIVAGEYTGSLRNSGEEVVLEAANGAIIASFTYLDDNPWPESPDGDGYSLVFTGSDFSSPLDWRPSVSIDGSPGGSDSTIYLGGSLTDYALGGEPVPLPSIDSFFLDILVNLAADDATLQVEFSSDLSAWTPATDTDLISRINHGDGTATLRFETPIPLNGETSHFGRVQIETP